MTSESQEMTGKSRDMNIEAECAGSSNTFFLNEHDEDLRYLKTGRVAAPVPVSAESAPQPPRSKEEVVEKVPAEAVSKDNDSEATTPAAPSSTPPRFAFNLLTLLLSNRDREVLLGDMEETFGEIEQSNGVRVARLWYWKQALLSIWPLIKMIIGGIVKSGLSALLGDQFAHWALIPKWLRPLIEEFLRRIIR